MTPGASENTYVLARRALLDAAEALVDQRDALVLVGAQAIYLQIGDDGLKIPKMTKDADFAVHPELLVADPLVELAMEGAGFTLDPPEGSGRNRQPGQWYDGAVQVDLLVPEGLATSKRAHRRSAPVPPHAKTTFGKARGLEASVVDFNSIVVTALEPHDDRAIELKVAGPMALIVAKSHKLHERVAAGRHDRIDAKDGHDIYRLLRAFDTSLLVAACVGLLASDIAGPVTVEALVQIEFLFGTPDAPGSVLVGEAEAFTGDADLARVQSSALARRLMDSSQLIGLCRPSRARAAR